MMIGGRQGETKNLQESPDEEIDSGRKKSCAASFKKITQTLTVLPASRIRLYACLKLEIVKNIDTDAGIETFGRLSI